MERGFSHPILRRAYMGLALARSAGMALGAGKAPEWVVLYYHAVRDAQREGFLKQMRHVAPRAGSIAEMLDGPGQGPRPRAAVTFDDGFVSVLENAVPVLAAESVPATVFAVAGAPGNKPSWQAGVDAGETMMTAAQLRQLPADLVTVGSHGMTHRPLDTLPLEEAGEELAGSRRALEDILGRKVTAFAFPYGAYNERLCRMAFDAGYEQVFTIDACGHPGPLPHGLIGRFAAEPDEPEAQFRLKAAGAYDWLWRVRGAKARVSGGNGR